MRRPSISTVRTPRTRAASKAPPLCNHLFQGIGAEKKNPRLHASVEAFEKVVRDRLADWADFEMVATHHVYGFPTRLSRRSCDPKPNGAFAASKPKPQINVLFQINAPIKVILLIEPQPMRGMRCYNGIICVPSINRRVIFNYVS